VLFPGGADGDFDVLAEGGEEFHEAADAEVAGAVAHKQGDLGLLNAENFGEFDLGQAAVLEDGIDLQGELGFEQLLLGIGETEVGEDVAAAFCYARGALFCFLCFSFHFSFAFLDGPALLPRAVA
jgi:hypothetical protein